MEPLEIALATVLIGKIADELAARTKHPKLKKYIGLLSWLANLYTRKK